MYFYSIFSYFNAKRLGKEHKGMTIFKEGDECVPKKRSITNNTETPEILKTTTTTTTTTVSFEIR